MFQDKVFDSNLNFIPVCLSLYYVILQIEFLEGTYELNVNLIYFSSRMGCCTSQKFTFSCHLDCTQRFEFCVKLKRTPHYINETCLQGIISTGEVQGISHHFGNTIGEIANPIIFNDTVWPVSYN